MWEPIRNEDSQPHPRLPKSESMFLHVPQVSLVQFEFQMCWDPVLTILFGLVLSSAPIPLPFFLLL
jgi:hypothetical protein